MGRRGALRRRRGRDGGGRRGGGRFDSSSRLVIVGSSSIVKESQSCQDQSSENKTCKKEEIDDTLVFGEDEKIVFFDFKKDKFGVLHFGAVRATPDWLLPCLELYIRCEAARPERFINHYLSAYDILDGKVVIGHDIKSQLQALEDTFHHIDKEPPKPKKAIDTLPFIRSKTELAKFARQHGLGKKAYYGLKACLTNLFALTRCGYAMSTTTERAVHGVNPIILHIVKCGTEESGTEESGTEESGTVEEPNERNGVKLYISGRGGPPYQYYYEVPDSSSAKQDPVGAFLKCLHEECSRNQKVLSEKIQSAGQPARRRSRRVMDKEAMKNKDKPCGRLSCGISHEE